jgi:hypothetical protein
MPAKPPITCDDCFFRRAELCAIPGNIPCPTFRSVVRQTIAPPRQPLLVPVPQLALVAATAAA